MENVDQLFQLIHSLSKSEKRYFKIHSSLQAGNKMYIELFDLIEKQRQYDEKSLKSKLKIAAFAVAKVYLYNLILKNLRSQSNNSIKKKHVIELLENAENLLVKGLFDQSYKQLMKAKKIAERFQQLPLLIEIYQLEYALSNISENKNLQRELYTNSNKGFNDSIAALNEQFEYRKTLRFVVSKANQMGLLVRNKKEKTDMDKHIAKLLKKKPEDCLSFKAKIFHYNLFAVYYLGNNNMEEAYKQNKKGLIHLNSDKEMLTQEISNYISFMNNIMNCLVQMGRYEEMLTFIDKMKKLPVEGSNQKARIFAFTASRQVLYYIATQQYQNGLKYITELKKQIPLHESKMNHTSFFALCGNIEEFYFSFGDFKQMLYWNNRILNHPEVKLYNHFYSNAKLCEMIIHYELDNMDTLQSLIKSYQLFLKNNPSKGKFELVCLSFLKKLAAETDLRKSTLLFIDFLKEVEKLSASPFEKGVFHIFDLDAWLKSNIA